MSTRDEKRRGPGRPTNPIRRSDLLASARSCFARSGFAGTTMEAIATSAGLTKGALFYHFKSKQELYLAVVSEIIEDLGKLISGAGLDEGGFVDRLDRLGGLVVDYLGSHPDAAKLLVTELVRVGPFVTGPGGELVRATMEITAAFLQAGMDEGAFRRQDPKHLALTIAGVHLLYFAASEVTGG